MAQKESLGDSFIASDAVIFNQFSQLLDFSPLKTVKKYRATFSGKRKISSANRMFSKGV